MGYERYVCQHCDNKGYFLAGHNIEASENHALLNITIHKCYCDKALEVNQIDLKRALEKAVFLLRRNELL